MRKLTWLVASAIVLTLLIGGRYPLYYEIEPVSARLVDSETKEPISGAAVGVYWTMFKSAYHSSGRDAGLLGLQKVISNDKGYFIVPGYEKWWLEWFSTRKISGSPRVEILKSGYIPLKLSISNLKKNNAVSESPEIAFWGKKTVKGLNDQIITLEKLPLDPETRYRIFHKTLLSMHARSCKLWDAYISSFVTEVYQEQKYAIQAGLNLGLSDDERKDILNFEHSNLDSCLRLAKYLRKQKL